MGLFNVIKLANDYNKAKKALNSKKVEASKLKGFIEKVKQYLDWLEGFKAEIEEYIAKGKELYKKLQERLKEEKK